jgi:peptide deformylase
VIRYPNPILRRPCEPATARAASRLAEDLVDTMRAHDGCVGLAAPQIGEPLRVAVVDVSGHRLHTSGHGLILLVAPVIQQRDGRRIAREGCLSLPEITADVSRAERIVVAPSGDLDGIWSEGFEARAIQHEIDHLDGVLILDRVASLGAVHARLPPSRMAGAGRPANYSPGVAQQNDRETYAAGRRMATRSGAGGTQESLDGHPCSRGATA